MSFKDYLKESKLDSKFDVKGSIEEILKNKNLDKFDASRIKKIDVNDVSPAERSYIKKLLIKYNID